MAVAQCSEVMVCVEGYARDVATRFLTQCRLAGHATFQMPPLLQAQQENDAEMAEADAPPAPADADATLAAAPSDDRGAAPAEPSAVAQAHNADTDTDAAPPPPPVGKQPTKITAQKFNYIRSMLAKKLLEVGGMKSWWRGLV